MKKISVLIVSIIMALSFATSAYATETKPVSVWYNNEEVQFTEQAPIIEQGTTLVPARAFLEKLGFEIGWNDAEKLVTASTDTLTIKMKINEKSVLINDDEYTLDVAPKIVNKHTLVPLRFIAEAAGYKVSWDPDQRAAVIISVKGSEGFLWKVENNDNTVYLLGSIHIANEEMYPLRAEIEEAFAVSDRLAVEVDIDNALDDELIEYINEISTYQDGTTLPDHISKETYALLGELLTELDLPTDLLDDVKVWNVSNVLPFLAPDDSGFDPILGIDQYFLTHATAQSMPILELESYKLQLGMFENFSPELQEELLLSSILSFNSPDESVGIQHLSDMWINGDEEFLLALVEEMLKQPEYYKAMLEDRNIAMVDKIVGYLNEKEPKTTFVVVGSLHMLGKHGLVPLLEEKGFTVEKQ